MYKLFCFKQKLLGDTRDKEGIKWHMIGHFHLYIDQFGPPCTFDMISSEKKHGVVKDVFDTTSKRYGTTSEEILSKVMTTRAVSEVWKEELKDILEQKPDSATINRVSSYTSFTDIVFESTSGALSRSKIEFCRISNKFKILDTNCPFVNPILTADAFSNTFQKFYEESKQIQEDDRVEGIYVKLIEIHKI
jgi:hypothetical protein